MLKRMPLPGLVLTALGIILSSLLPGTAQVLLLNEIDPDQGSTDSAEFIELFDGGQGYFALDDYDLLIFNGPGYTVTAAFDLAGFSTDSRGYFMLAGQDVAQPGDVHVDLPDESLPDTATILILYEKPLDLGAIVDIHSLDPLQIVDAVVYGVDSPDDTTLLSFLAAGQPQLNANAFGQTASHSLQRLNDGIGGAKMTDAWVAALPTAYQPNLGVVLINEVDAETVLNDEEFIEIYDGGLGMQPLDGLVVVLVDGGTDSSYGPILDLAGQTTDDNGYFLIGNSDVPGVDLVLPSDSMQHGVDGVALYTGTAADFASRSVETASLVDSLVYHTNDALPPGSTIMDLLLPGEDMVNEDQYNGRYIHSMQRFFGHSGGRRATRTYTLAKPTPKADNHATPLINEVDSDQGVTDSVEFIELYDQGRGLTSLDGYFLVLFDGATDSSYLTLDLDGFQTDEQGFFLIGTSEVLGSDITILPEQLHDGVHAVALYQGDPGAFPHGTPVTTLNLEDAVVYSLGNPDDAGLLPLLQAGQPQVNENLLGLKNDHSIQRFPDGEGGPGVSEFYQAAFPTPGLPNSVRSNRVLINEMDVQTVGTNSLEFIELFDGGAGLTSLDGLILVLYNGTSDSSYLTVDLNGYTTDEQGYFLLGTAQVAAEFDVQTDLVLGDSPFQDGPDAAVLYLGRADDFPNGTALVLNQIEDAIVYDTADSDDSELLSLLNPGQPQVDEAGRGNSGAHSMQRFPNGSGGSRNTSSYTMALPTPDGPNMEAVLINEVDADTTGTDQMEFVELYDGGRGNVQLDGLVLVFYDGLDDSPYLIQDLDGFTTDSDGYFVVGNAAVLPAVDIVIPDDSIENGADAVALYNADEADFMQRSVVQENLLDALVYDTDDANDSGLLVLLNLGQDQVNEASLGNKDAHSMQRSPNGTGGPRNSSTYIAAVATPSASNITWSYSTRFTDLENPGNPRGLNVENDDNLLNWTEITTANKHTNSWSSPRDIGFDFVFFGNAVTQFKVSQNGLLTFSTDVDLLPGDVVDNLDLVEDLDPFNPLFPNLTICAFWDSFTDAPPTGPNDKVYMKVFGAEPNRQLWIKWASFEYGNPNSAYNYFGIVLEETTHIINVIDYNWHSEVPISSTVAMYSNSRHFVQYEPVIGEPDQISFLEGNTRSAEQSDNDYYQFFPITNLVDLELTLTRVGPPSPHGINVGDEVTYHLQAANLGQNGATSVVVNLDLSNKVSYLDHSSQGRPFDSFSGNWNVGFLPPNSSAGLLVTVLIEESHEILHAAEAIEMVGFDIDSVVNNHVLAEDDQVELLELVPDAADLALHVSADRPVANLGDQVTFSIQAVNDGPDAAHNVCVDLNLPVGLQYVSDTGGGSLVNGIWSLPLLSEGSSGTIELTAEVQSVNAPHYMATYQIAVCGLDEYDPDLDNNQEAYTLNFRKGTLYVSPVSGEVQVNQFTPGIQAFPSVDMTAMGDYSVTWQSEGGQDGNLSGVYGRQFSTPTTALGNEMLINFFTANHQRYSQVALSNSGHSYIVWQDEGQNGLWEGIYGLQLDSSGQPVLPGQFQANHFLFSSHFRPDISLDGMDNQVIVWASDGQDGDGFGIFARRFDPNNSPLGVEIEVNDTVAGDQKFPRVAVGDSGEFVAVWQSWEQDGDGWGIVARSFGADGIALGPEFLVTEQVAGDQIHPDIAVSPSGSFVIVWQGPKDGTKFGIYARQFDVNCQALGPEQTVNSDGNALAASPRIDMDGSGNYVVVWYELGLDGDGAGVYGQQFKANSVPEGMVFQINTTTAHDQSFPDVACNSSGQFVVAWQSYLQDSDDEGVFLRAFDPPCEPLRDPSAWPVISVLDLLICVE